MTEKQADGVELYESSDGSISLQVQTDRETVWVSRQQMAELFGRDITTIGKHISNARLEELDGTAVNGSSSSARLFRSCRVRSISLSPEWRMS